MCMGEPALKVLAKKPYINFLNHYQVYQQETFIFKNVGYQGSLITSLTHLNLNFYEISTQFFALFLPGLFPIILQDILTCHFVSLCLGMGYCSLPARFFCRARAINPGSPSKLYSQPLCCCVYSETGSSVTLNSWSSCLRLSRGCDYKHEPPHLASIISFYSALAIQKFTFYVVKSFMAS